MARPEFKPGYSVSRICVFIHSAFEIFYNILKCLIDMKELDSVVFLKKPSLLHYIQNLLLKFYIGFLPRENERSREAWGNVWVALFLYLDNPISYIFLLVVLNLLYTLYALPHYFTGWWSFSIKFFWTKEIRGTSSSSRTNSQTF